MASVTSYIAKALQGLQSDQNSLPPYDEESIHQTQLAINSFNQLIQQIEEDPQKDDESRMKEKIFKLYSDRLSEGLELYKRARILRLIDIQNSCRGQLPPQVRKSQTPSEVEFLDKYRKSLANFSKKVGFIPFTDNPPPCGLNAEVLVLADASSILVGEGFLSVRKNQILTIRSQKAQELEHAGLVQIIKYLK